MPDIMPAERSVFDRERALIETGPVVDIGIGAGRTTGFLAPLCRHYVGIDYSPAMIAHCRRLFMESDALRLILADAASMPMLDSASFKFILFSFNGIDSVDHPHRLRILREVHRLLAPGGRFAFSAHNRFFSGIQRAPQFRRPLRLRGIARTGVEFLNHWRARRENFACGEYEMINDPPHLFSVITYYIDRRAQIAQLGREGFRVLAVFGADGRELNDDADETLSPNFTYLTERRS